MWLPAAARAVVEGTASPETRVVRVAADGMTAADSVAAASASEAIDALRTAEMYSGDSVIGGEVKIR